MEQNQPKTKARDFVTKELFILFTPFFAAYLWSMFYEAGYAEVFNIPSSLIQLDIMDVLLANRLTLIAATVAFLWIGLYYNLLPSLQSPLFRGLITILLILAVGLGFFFGRSNAQNNLQFLTTSYNNQELVVLRVYRDNIVTAPLNRSGKKILPSFYIFKVGKKPHLKLDLETIGPLVF